MADYKELDEVKDKLVKALDSHLSAGIQNADAQEIGYVAGAINDMAEAKEKCAKACYYEKITEAMDHSEYGEDYDEDGPKFYRGRNSKGQYTHRAFTVPHVPTDNGYRVHYYGENSGSANHSMNGSSGRSYTEGESQRSYNEGYNDGHEDGRRRGYEEAMSMQTGGKYDEKHKEYEEMQERHEDSAKKVQGLQQYLGVINEDLSKAMKAMDVQEKQLLRNTPASITNKIS